MHRGTEIKEGEEKPHICQAELSGLTVWKGRLVSAATIPTTTIVWYLHQCPAVICAYCEFMIYACGLIYFSVKCLSQLASCH